ncbi:ATP-binding cassette domain-containing protein [Aeromonas schubertii]|uniref:ATP-binding cassette domain-containing protein n=1 Tax=Aeromonas schubertii TaxID=652 RepID=A0ABS7VFW5_9GAMM|nr:ATP-binding cassette domain-containing protein [Aeromonas schubertii]MBZ6067851.1 ATP-binding cassette domain-containing protein [Aeromonas schubertii]
MLSVQSFTLYQGDRPLLRVPDFSIAPGAPLTLMGPSGCGKSSLLAALLGALPERGQNAVPSRLEGHGPLSWEGCFTLAGERLREQSIERRGIGILFQDDLLFAHLTVAQNLLFAVPAGDPQARLDAVGRALDDAGLGAFGQRLPHQLSGGERARVSLLRTLLARPRALLLDEPFSRLDQPLRAAFRHWVFARCAAIPVLLVTHDPEDAPGEILRLAPENSHA